MARLLGPRQRVADLGAADGRLLRKYRATYPDTGTLVGVEIDEDRTRAELNGLQWVIGDALGLPDQQSFDGILSNPPYIRTSDISQTDRESYRGSFESAWGQFDLWFLFVEKAIHLLVPGGRAVFLIPEGLSQRPAAARLRAVIAAACSWHVLRPAGEPFERSVGVAAEILILDKKAVPETLREQAKSGVERSDQSKLRVGVGAATGAREVFVRDEADPWLTVVEKQFQRRVVGFGRHGSSSEIAVWPYIHNVRKRRPELADLGEHPGLSKFVEAHSAELARRTRPTNHGYIQSPPWSYSGARLVIPEVFSSPRVLKPRKGSLVLNNAFCVHGNASDVTALRKVLADPGCARELVANARLLSAPYSRFTASGLATAIHRLSRNCDTRLDRRPDSLGAQAMNKDRSGTAVFNERMGEPAEESLA
jgi:23S rRNA U2552 (ribose-2'-O)-methylase RlmE/FtsJ